MFRCKGPQLALGMALTMIAPAATAVAPIDDGDFESGALAGWSVSGQLDGVAGVVTEGECFSDFDTTGIVLSGNHAGLVRAGKPAEPGSTGLLTSAPFTAGIGVAFKALTESLDGRRLPDMPVNFSVRLLAAEGGVQLAAVGLTTSVVELDGDCYTHPVDGAFRTHYIDTRRFTGQRIRLQFAQSSKVRRAGLFTLVDDVVRLDEADAQVLPDRPRAVAGVSRSGSGRLRLDGSLSSEPSRMVLTHAWRVAGEAFRREGEFPCIDDLEPGDHRATLVVSNGLYSDADSVRFVIREAALDGDDDDGDMEDDAQQTGADLGLETSADLDCGDAPGDGDTSLARGASSVESRDFRHFNPSTWDGQGVAIVMCHWTNDMDACSLNGEPMALHPNQSLGRDVWADYDGPTGQNGTIECMRGTQRFVFNVTATTELEYGACRPGSGL